MKINKRLAALSEMVSSPYDIVWDCCCDHGLLGMKILAECDVKQVNFIDIVPEIMHTLAAKMTAHADKFPETAKWNVICNDVSTLDLSISNNYSGKSEQQSPKQSPKQLVIISGVGGDLMIEMVKALVSRHADIDIDYLLCPVQHTYKVRKALIDLRFKLKQERLIIDNHRGYELFLVNQNEGVDIALTGDSMWENNEAHRRYLSNLIVHYDRINNAEQLIRNDNYSALNMYKNILKDFFDAKSLRFK